MAVDLPTPRVGAPGENGNGAALGLLNSAAPEPMRVVLNWGRRYSLWVFNFGLACCAIEFIATSMARHDFIRLGVIPFAPGPRQADLMVVSGTVSDKMAPAVKRLYDQMPEPKYVISFGSCSNCGGPYWDSYCVTKGVDQIIPVDVYVPGCPPRPEALLQGIIKLQEKIAGEDLAARYSGRDPRPAPKLPFLRRAAKPRAALEAGPADLAELVRAQVAAAPASTAAENTNVPVVAVTPMALADTAITEPIVAEPVIAEPVIAEPDLAATIERPVSLLPPQEDAPTVVLPAIPPTPPATPVVKPAKSKPPKLFYRRYPKELKRSRDIGLNILNQKPDSDDD